MPKFSIKQSFDYGKVLNMLLALHRVLNMLEHALTEFWIYLGLYISYDSDYGRVSEYARVTQSSKYATIWLNIWIGREYTNKCREVTLQVNQYLLRDRRIQNLLQDLRWSSSEKYSF